MRTPLGRALDTLVSTGWKKFRHPNRSRMMKPQYPKWVAWEFCGKVGRRTVKFGLKLWERK